MEGPNVDLSLSRAKQFEDDRKSAETEDTNNELPEIFIGRFYWSLEGIKPARISD